MVTDLHVTIYDAQLSIPFSFLVSPFPRSYSILCLTFIFTFFPYNKYKEDALFTPNLFQ